LAYGEVNLFFFDAGQLYVYEVAVLVVVKAYLWDNRVFCFFLFLGFCWGLFCGVFGFGFAHAIHLKTTLQIGWGSQKNFAVCGGERFLGCKLRRYGMRERLVWQRQVLPNGARLLCYPKAALTAQLAVAVKYGANDDADGLAGAAHFLEHMVPGGSARRIGLSRQVECLGGLGDFYTNHEYTVCLSDVAPGKLGQASEAMAAMFGEPDFASEQFQAERHIILHELADAEDDPRQKASELLAQALYKTHPARRPIGGYPKTVRQLTLQNLTEVYLQQYVPQNMVVILSGNFSEADVEGVVEDFGCDPKPKPPAKSKRDPETGKPKSVCKARSGLLQTYLCIGARTAASGHPDVAAVDLLNVILGAGASSRLFIELREKQALTYDVGSTQTEGTDFAYFSINCATKPKNVPQAQKLILRELERLRTENVPEAELSKGKDMIVGDIFRAVDNAQSCPEVLAVMEMRFGTETCLLDYITKVKAVSADEVRAAAERYLDEGKLATAVLEPKA
jgi:zinc protease